MAEARNNGGPLDYESPRPRASKGTAWVAKAERSSAAGAGRLARRVRSIWVVGLFVLHVLLAGAPSLQRAFSGVKEFNVDLPLPTRALFALALWWRESWGWLILTPALLLLLLAVFRSTKRAGEAAGGLLLVFSVLLWGGLLASFVLAIFLPLVRLIEALAK